MGKLDIPGLNNPFVNTKNGLNQPLPRPNMARVGNVNVITTKPIIEKQQSKFDIPFNPIKKRQYQQLDFSKPEKYNTDKEKSKVSNKRILTIGGSILGLAIIGFIIYKVKNKAK